jgi:hypothetical protein
LTIDRNDVKFPCPKCGDRAKFAGCFFDIDYIKCPKCGYYGDHFEQDGVVYDIEVPTKDGLRCRDDDAYYRRIAELEQEFRNGLTTEAAS